jgi:hypothetical protein
MQKEDYGPLEYWGGVVPLKRRIGRMKEAIENRDAIFAELLAIGASNITDICSWDEEGNVVFRPPKSIPLHALKAIKKIKVTKTKDGQTLEIELYDKNSALRVLAKAAGLLENHDEGENRPSVIGINMHGPDTLPAEYKEVVEELIEQNHIKD